MKWKLVALLTYSLIVDNIARADENANESTARDVITRKIARDNPQRSQMRTTGYSSAAQRTLKIF